MLYAMARLYLLSSETSHLHLTGSSPAADQCLSTVTTCLTYKESPEPMLFITGVNIWTTLNPVSFPLW